MELKVVAKGSERSVGMGMGQERKEIHMHTVTAICTNLSELRLEYKNILF